MVNKMLHRYNLKKKPSNQLINKFFNLEIYDKSNVTNKTGRLKNDHKLSYSLSLM